MKKKNDYATQKKLLIKQRSGTNQIIYIRTVQHQACCY